MLSLIRTDRNAASVTYACHCNSMPEQDSTSDFDASMQLLVHVMSSCLRSKGMRNGKYKSRRKKGAAAHRHPDVASTHYAVIVLD